MTPSLHDVAWAAGFLEGEGSFHLWTKKDSRYAGGVCQYPRVKASQNDREPLERLLDAFGGSINVERHAGSDRPNRKTIWYWALTGDRAVAVMEAVLPLMSSRRKVQIFAALGRSGVV